MVDFAKYLIDKRPAAEVMCEELEWHAPHPVTRQMRPPLSSLNVDLAGPAARQIFTASVMREQVDP